MSAIGMTAIALGVCLTAVPFAPVSFSVPGSCETGSNRGEERYEPT
jgi:hypothetical protein